MTSCPINWSCLYFLMIFLISCHVSCPQVSVLYILMLSPSHILMFYSPLFYENFMFSCSLVLLSSWYRVLMIKGFLYSFYYSFVLSCSLVPVFFGPGVLRNVLCYASFLLRFSSYGWSPELAYLAIQFYCILFPEWTFNTNLSNSQNSSTLWFCRVVFTLHSTFVLSSLFQFAEILELEVSERPRGVTLLTLPVGRVLLWWCFDCAEFRWGQTSRGHNEMW